MTRTELATSTGSLPSLAGALGEVVIRTEELAAGYRSAPVWTDANFEIRSGEFIAVLGQNGAGKSTLLKVVLGLLAPLSGRVEVLGMTPREASRLVGYVPQTRSLDVGSAIRGSDLVRFGLDGTRWGLPPIGRGRREARSRVEEAVAAVGASGYAERRLGEVSGGERQRLLLAEALVGEPRLLLLDEPLASLDIGSQVMMARLVASIARSRSLAVVLVAHDVNQLLPVVDRVIYVAHGRLEIGVADEIVTTERLSRLYGSEVEVVFDRRGRRIVIGLEEEARHPHAVDDSATTHVIEGGAS